MVIMSENVRKTIEYIKEIVGNHTDNDVYNALQESNMDIHDATHKLLHQDTFHEVRKRRDKKKENLDYSDQVETIRRNDFTSHEPKFSSARNGHRGGYTRRGISREFRNVRDSRVNQKYAKETKPSTQVALSGMARRVYNVRGRSAYVASNKERHSGGRYDKNLTGGHDFRLKVAQEFNYNTRKEHLKENVSAATGPDSRVSVTKQNESQLQSGRTAFSNAVGVYASAMESFRHINTVSRSDQDHEFAVESVMVNSTEVRSSNHFSNRLHQLLAGQKEWKPKTNQKPNVSSPGIAGSVVETTSSQTDTLKNLERETDELLDKLSQTNIHDTQNVIIPQNIRVPEFGRCSLNFGHIGMESESMENCSSAHQVADVVGEAVGAQPVQASPSNNQNASEDQVRNSASSSPSKSSENPWTGKNDSVEVLNTENYVDMNFVHNSSSLTTSMSEQLQESVKLPNLPAYDPQPVYDMPYFRSSVDDALLGTGLLSNQEAQSSQTANTVTDSTVTKMQQQTPISQMYPQVYLSQYANVMPYPQYIPPMYPPPMVPGYTSNPGYPLLSNRSSYVLMPGGASNIQQFEPFPAGTPTGGFGGLSSPTGYAVNPTEVIGGPTSLCDSSRLKYKDNHLYVQNPQLETSEVWIQNQSEHPEMQYSTAYFNMSGQTVRHPAYMQSHTSHPSFNTATQRSQMQFPQMYPPQPAVIPNNHHLGVGVTPSPPESRVQPQMNHLNWTTTNF